MQVRGTIPASAAGRSVRESRLGSWLLPGLSLTGTPEKVRAKYGRWAGNTYKGNASWPSKAEFETAHKAAQM